MGLNALQIAVLLERLGKSREGLVHRVGRDRADRAAEYVRFDQADRRGKFVLAE